MPRREVGETKIRDPSWQDPDILLPTAGGIAAGLYGLAAGPFWFAALPAAALSLGFAGWRYLKHRQEATALREEELKILRKRAQEEEELLELNTLEGTIRRNFTQMNFSKGSKELDELTHEYTELAALLNRVGNLTIIDIGQVRRLARDTYKQGLVLLTRTSESVRLTKDSNRASLQREIAELETDIKELSSKPSSTWRLEIQQERLKSNKERLARLEKHEENIERLLQQSDQCEATLHQTAIDIVGLDIESSDEVAQEVVKRLQNVIQMALAVQDMLKKSESLNA